MKRRIVCLAVSVSTILGMAVISAPTASAAKGTCTNSFSLVRTTRWGDEGAKIDNNGNGWLCQKPNPDGTTFNVVDDHA